MSSLPAKGMKRRREKEGPGRKTNLEMLKSLLREESGKAYDRKMVGHEEGSGKERII